MTDFENDEIITTSNNLSLEEYYIKRYQKIADEILNVRLNEVDITIETYKREIERYQSSLDNIDEIIMQDSSYLKNIDRIKEIVKGLNNEEQAFKDRLTPYQESLKNKQVILTNATIGYYNNILKQMNPIVDPYSLMDDVYKTVGYIVEQLFPMAKEANQLRVRISDLQKELNLTSKRVEEKKSELANEITDLTAKVTSLTKDGIENKINGLNELIESNYELKNELKSTFLIINEKNSEHIIDLIQYNHLKGMANEELMSLLDDELNKLSVSLKSQETFQSLKKAQEIKIKSLQEELSSISNYDDEYTVLRSIEDEYYKTIVQVTRSIDELNEFVKDANTIIEENEEFKTTYKEYTDFTNELIQVEAQLELTNSAISVIEKERNSKSMWSVATQELKALSAKLDELRETRSNLESSITSINEKIQQAEAVNNHKDLIKIIKEKTQVEEALPTIRERLREIKSRKTKVHEKIVLIEENLKKIEQIKQEIARINYELETEQ